MIKILRLKEEHIKEVYAIEIMSFSDPWSKAAFSELFQNPFYSVFVAIDAGNGGKTVGYIAARHIAEEAEIVNIAVHPEYRGMGIAEKLMKKILRYLMDIKVKIVMLEVRESNIAARGLYEKFGFYKTGVRTGYYRLPTEDAVLMNKDLEETTG